MARWTHVGPTWSRQALRQGWNQSWILCNPLQINSNHWAHATLHMMTYVGGLSLLLTMILDVSHAVSECSITEMCRLKKMRGISTNPSLMSKRSIFPITCHGMCSLRSDCTAVTDDVITEHCELHVADPERGAPCITWIAAAGSNFWIRKNPRNSCNTVRCGNCALVLPCWYHFGRNENVFSFLLGRGPEGSTMPPPPPPPP